MPHEGILRVIGQQHAGIVGISVTMLFNLPQLTSLISAVNREFGREKVRVIVGGPAFRAAHGLWKLERMDSRTMHGKLRQWWIRSYKIPRKRKYLHASEYFGLYNVAGRSSPAALRSGVQRPLTLMPIGE
jgi:hypothetical protein